VQIFDTLYDCGAASCNSEMQPRWDFPLQHRDSLGRTNSSAHYFPHQGPFRR
jgi:hypothetical protein